MRTTVNLRPEALDLCRERSRERGVPMGEILSDAVLAAFGDRPGAAEPSSWDLPTAGAGGLRPGVDLDRWCDLEDLLDERG